MTHHKPFLPLLTALLLCGCVSAPFAPRNAESAQETSISQSSDSAQSSAAGHSAASAPVRAFAQDTLSDPTKAPLPDSLPVISIQTQKTGADALDFITEPVARHVAEAVASWTPGYVIPPAPYYEPCTVSCGSLSAEAQVKARGNWTTKYDKKPLRIKFESKKNLLGLNSGAEMKNWLLLAEYKDASLLRNRAVLQASRAVLGADNLYAADAALVEVEVNGEYWGVYLLTEQQQVHPARIDITEPEKGYTGTDIGYFLEFDGYFINEDDLHAFHVDYADNAPLKPYDGKGGSGKTINCLPKNNSRVKDVGFSIKSDIYSAEQRDFIANYVNNVYRVLYAAAYENKALVFNDDCTAISESKDVTPREAVEAAINVDSLADAYIIAELTCDADIYWSSFFMDADLGAGGDRRLTFEAPWDFDSGLGNKDRCADGTGFYAANIVPDVNGREYETVNPWLAVLMYEDWFQALIRAKWTAIEESGIMTHICAQITDVSKKYSDAFSRDNERWGVSTKDPEFDNELYYRAKKCASQSEAAAYLREWLEARVKFMNESWGTQ